MASGGDSHSSDMEANSAAQETNCNEDFVMLLSHQNLVDQDLDVYLKDEKYKEMCRIVGKDLIHELTAFPLGKHLVEVVCPHINEAEPQYKEWKFKECLMNYVTATKKAILFQRKVEPLEDDDKQKVAIKKFTNVILSRAEELKESCLNLVHQQEINSDLYKNILQDMTRDCSRNYDSVCGLEGVREILTERIICPHLFPNLFRNHLQRPLLLYGYPGTGKSLILEATACEVKLRLFVFNMYQLENRHYGGSPENVCKYIKTVFQVARDNSPCILVLEDIDVLCKPDDIYRCGKAEFLTQIYTHMQPHRSGCGHASENKEDSRRIFIVGVTQKMWELDGAVRRKFDRRFVPLPFLQARFDMLNLFLADLTHDLKDEDVTEMALKLEGFTGADISTVVRDASMRRVMQLVKAKYFKKVLVSDLKPKSQGPAKAGSEDIETSDQATAEESTTEECEGETEQIGVAAATTVDGDNTKLPAGASGDLASSSCVSTCEQQHPTASATTGMTTAEPALATAAATTKKPTTQAAATPAVVTIAAASPEVTAAVTDVTAPPAADSPDVPAPLAAVPNTGNQLHIPDQLNTPDQVHTSDHPDTSCALSLCTDSESCASVCPDPDGSSNTEVDKVEKWMPCEADEDGAVAMSVYNIEPDKLWLYPEVTKESMLWAYDEIRASVSDDDILRMMEFIENFDDI